MYGSLFVMFFNDIDSSFISDVFSGLCRGYLFLIYFIPDYGILYTVFKKVQAKLLTCTRYFTYNVGTIRFILLVFRYQINTHLILPEGSFPLKS